MSENEELLTICHKKDTPNVRLRIVNAFVVGLVNETKLPLFSW